MNTYALKRSFLPNIIWILLLIAQLVSVPNIDNINDIYTREIITLISIFIISTVLTYLHIIYRESHKNIVRKTIYVFLIPMLYPLWITALSVYGALSVQNEGSIMLYGIAMFFSLISVGAYFYFLSIKKVVFDEGR
jgi:hypothetical protein